jgi:hypothetical protein
MSLPAGNFNSGTSDKDRTGYLRVLFLFPAKLIFESISTILKRSIVAMVNFMA